MGLNSQIVDLSQVHKIDEDLVGKKAHELGVLCKLGIPLPKGFVILPNFFKEFLRLVNIDKEIYKSPSLKHPALSHSIDSLFQKKIIQTHLPHLLATELHNYYKKLSGLFKNRPLNIYSSSPNNKSIVFSNVRGDANFIQKIKTIWSLSFKKAVTIVVQENIKAETKGKISTNSPVTDKKLTEKQITELTNYCKIIQKHFYFPKEIEYAVNKGKIFITHLNPFTGTVAIKESSMLTAQNKQKGKILIRGTSINSGIVTGPARILNRFRINAKIKKEEILIIHNLNAALFKEIKNAKGVAIDSVLPSSLSKIFYRKDFHIPTVEGAKNATKTFQNGNVVTVNGMTGEIYSGGLVY